MKVYVAAPYEDAGLVRSVHDLLVSHGLTPTSRWAMTSTGPEDFTSKTALELRAIAAENDADVFSADACLVLARRGAGGEMFAEARIAWEWGKPIVWVGRRTLSAWRAGVVLAEDIDDAIRILVGAKGRKP